MAFEALNSFLLNSTDTKVVFSCQSAISKFKPELSGLKIEKDINKKEAFKKLKYNVDTLTLSCLKTINSIRMNAENYDPQSVRNSKAILELLSEFGFITQDVLLRETVVDSGQI